jgi:tetratricopeptide (TPR) repeat protein
LIQPLSQTLRVAFTLVALSASGTAIAATATPAPSTTGEFLAGQQAMADLRTGDAATYFRDAATAQWDNPMIVERAMVALAADGRIDDAADMARHLLDLDAGNQVARLVVGAVELKQRKYETVEAELKDVGTDSFPALTATILRAWALVGENRLDDAESLLAEIGDEGLADFLVFHRALMADVAGKPDVAIGLAKEAYEADPLVARLVEAYARMLGNSGRFDEAIDVIVQYEASGATHPLVDVVKAALAKKRRPGMFAPTVQAGAAEMFHSIGIALARDPSADLAVVLLRLGMYLDPDSDIVGMSLAELFDAHNRHEEANALYEAVAADSPMKPLATVRVAENLDALGNREEAIRRLNNILVSDPDDLDAVSVLGDLYRDDERFADAAAAYTKALEITGGSSPGDWRFYYVRGIAYERNKEWPKAEADFLKALDLNPDQPQVLNYLGYSWVDQGTHLSEALGMIQKAVSAAPNDGYIIDSLGWAYYRLGRYGQAVQVLEQAVQLLPNDPEINDHLGDAYWRIGRKLEARFQWNIAMSVDEKGEVRARVLPKLANGLDAVPESKAAEVPQMGSQAAVR